MASKIKNIIIFTVIAAILILAYIFFIKPAPEQQNLVSSSTSSTTTDTTSTDTSTLDQNSAIAQNFLSVLLSVKSIKLDDTIFSDPAFVNLHDSSILLTAPGDEGRTNPFAPIGYDTPATITTPPSSTPSAPIIPATPSTTVKTP